jgi:uncharacterized Rmd1/YagE family protein
MGSGAYTYVPQVHAHTPPPAAVVLVLLQVLRASFPASAIKSYPDVFYVEYFAASDDAPGGDLFFFDYGVVACWGLDSAQVRQINLLLAF